MSVLISYRYYHRCLFHTLFKLSNRQSNLKLQFRLQFFFALFQIKIVCRLRQTIYVPEAGLEPAYLSAHAPETCVSTSSTIPVYVVQN